MFGDEVPIEPRSYMSHARELSVMPTASLGFKNRLINGDFQIAQRTTGSSATPNAGATSYQSVDRWFVAQTGTTAQLNQRQIDGQVSRYAGRFGRVSGQTNVPATVFMGQQVESHNMHDLRGHTCTVSFRAYRGANAPSSLGVVARFGTGVDQASGGGITGSWTGFSGATGGNLTVSTTPQEYTYTFTVPAGANEMNLLFYYSPSGTAGAEEWFGLENVQLEKGTVATEFDRRSVGTELALCQRYFYQVNSPSNTAYLNGIGSFQTTRTIASIVPIPVSMRSTPSFAFSTLQLLTPTFSTVYAVSAASTYTGQNGTWAIDLTHASLTAGNLYTLAIGAGGYVSYSAEL